MTQEAANIVIGVLRSIGDLLKANPLLAYFTAITVFSLSLFAVFITSYLRSRNADEGAILRWKNLSIGEFKSARSQQINALEEQFTVQSHLIRVLTVVSEEINKLQSYLLQALLPLAHSNNVSYFGLFLREFANSLTKITYDKNSDKFSAIWTIDSDTGIASIVASNGLRHASRERQFRIGEGFVGWVWQNGQAEAIGNVKADWRFQAPFTPSGEYNSIIGVPVRGAAHEILGILTVQSRDSDAFIEEDLSVVGYFASFLGLALTMFAIIMNSGEGVSDDEAGDASAGRETGT